ncbi:unnamed protein product [Somion occarium]|uniref:Helicase C-terminal domain-containing protein n=1 Tax=Somion occarium TaxID=3059160 RepID=A0ABP1DFC2_9APHY
MFHETLQCCTGSPLSHSQVADPLFNIHKFLAAGTIAISLTPNYAPNIVVHVSDLWHILPGLSALSALVHPDEIAFIRILDFLSQHHFIRATCRFGHGSLSSALLVRIYLIPYDLANVQGQLRIREDAILTAARRYLRILLPRIVQDISEWNGGDAQSSTLRKLFYGLSQDDRTMAEIYSSLPSPVASEVSPLANAILDGTTTRLRSELHPYQRCSVIAMLGKELSPHGVPDPLYIPIRGVDVQQMRGGILCEELGTGKTVMVLGLVCATVDQSSSPEESLLDDRPVMTPISFNSLTSPSSIASRQRLNRVIKSRPAKSNEAESPQIPSLRAILLHYLRTHPDGLNVRYHHDDLEDRQLLQAYQANVPFYLHYNEEPLDTNWSRRRRTEPKPRIMYLTTATIIIVPVNLLYQWEMEVLKHCEDPLRLLVIRDTKPLPPASELASLYDIILMSQTRFSAEATKDCLEKLHTWKRCNCPPVLYSQVTITNCQCHRHDDVSPLFQVRWKRLVIDEGHVASSSTTNLVSLSKKLSIERKWIVTGTPTTNLMGLHFGEGSELQYPEDVANSAANDVSPRSDISSSDLSSAEEEPFKPIRVWTSDDRQDLNKLANMMVHFLQAPQFASDSKLFTNLVINSLMAPSGPLPHSIEVLTQVMNTVMIRHQITDVEKDILLPILSHETVLLDLDPYALKTYNVMQATIAVNAIDSERVDQDYLFHPRNVGHLQQIIENMSQAMFWHTDENYFNADEILKDSEGYLKRTAERASQQDLTLLKDALHHLKSAASDPVWRALLCHANVFHRAFGIPEAIYQAWTPLPASVSSITDFFSSNPYSFCHPEHLFKLHQLISKRPLLNEAGLIDIGYAVRKEELLRYRFNMSRLQMSKAGKRQKDHLSDKTMKLKEFDLTSPGKLKHIRQELIDAQDRVQTISAGATPGEHVAPHETYTTSPLLAKSPLAQVRIGNTTSSKLNYIINDILLHAKTEKFLIFSRSPLTLAYISEALDVIRVKSLHFTSKVNLKTREQYVTTFETSDTYRVFLMELKHGARGLNLVSASRVIFCEPVWQADVETQAIKRVHRIGQIRPVIVKTLAIRLTYEETMVSRREALRSGLGSSGGKLPDMTDDRTMRDFLANPTFLPDPPPPEIELDIPLLGDEAARESNRLASLPEAGAKKPLRYMLRDDDSDDDFDNSASAHEEGTSMQMAPTHSNHTALSVNFDRLHASSRISPTIKRVRLILPPEPASRDLQHAIGSNPVQHEDPEVRPRKKPRLSVRFAV